MQIHEFIRHLAPSEWGKRLIIVNYLSTPLFEGTLNNDTLTELNRKGLSTENIMLIKTGTTYIKILSERGRKENGIFWGLGHILCNRFFHVSIVDVNVDFR